MWLLYIRLLLVLCFWVSFVYRKAFFFLTQPLYQVYSHLVIYFQSVMSSANNQLFIGGKKFHCPVVTSATPLGIHRHLELMVVFTSMHLLLFNLFLPWIVKSFNHAENYQTLAYLSSRFKILTFFAIFIKYLLYKHKNLI